MQDSRLLRYRDFVYRVWFYTGTFKLILMVLVVAGVFAVARPKAKNHGKGEPAIYPNDTPLKRRR